MGILARILVRITIGILEEILVRITTGILAGILVKLLRDSRQEYWLETWQESW